MAEDAFSRRAQAICSTRMLGVGSARTVPPSADNGRKRGNTWIDKSAEDAEDAD
jgi:hypothetical protein